MSTVTNVILTCSVGEDEALRLLNSKIRDYCWAEGSPFQDIEDTAPRVVAGNRALEATVVLGAFNFFRLTEFITALCAVPWRWPDQVQVFVKNQDDERFQELRIKVRPT